MERAADTSGSGNGFDGSDMSSNDNGAVELVPLNERAWARIAQAFSFG